MEGLLLGHERDLGKLMERIEALPHRRILVVYAGPPVPEGWAAVL